MQGETDYIKKTLNNLLNSNLQTGYQDSEIFSGECKDHGMSKVANNAALQSGQCFPKASLWHNGNPLTDPWVEHELKYKQFIGEYKQLHPDAIEDHPTVNCLK